MKIVIKTLMEILNTINIVGFLFILLFFIVMFGIIMWVTFNSIGFGW